MNQSPKVRTMRSEPVRTETHRAPGRAGEGSLARRTKSQRISPRSLAQPYQVGLLKSGFCEGGRASCCRYCCSCARSVSSSCRAWVGLRLMACSRSRWVCSSPSASVPTSVPGRVLRAPSAGLLASLPRSRPRCEPPALPVGTGGLAPWPGFAPPAAPAPAAADGRAGSRRPVASGRRSGGAVGGSPAAWGWLTSPWRPEPGFSPGRGWLLGLGADLAADGGAGFGAGAAGASAGVMRGPAGRWAR